MITNFYQYIGIYNIFKHNLDLILDIMHITLEFSKATNMHYLSKKVTAPA